MSCVEEPRVCTRDNQGHKKAASKRLFEKEYPFEGITCWGDSNDMLTITPELQVICFICLLLMP